MAQRMESDATMFQAQTYMHESEPQAVNPMKRAKPKYRAENENDENGDLSNNIMYDRRVVRGNTHAAQIVTQNAQMEMERIRILNDKEFKRNQARIKRERNKRPSTPPPIEGRVHTDCQTDRYLEELTDRPIETEAETQTEAILDRPPSPHFMPAKTGVDVETQIDPELVFDFDVEVTPILEVIVGKTLQTSMLEVMEEEELSAIRKRQDEFEQMRDAELLEVQRLEAEAARAFDEKNRRLKQEKERKRLQKELKEKIAARSFAKNYTSDLTSSVFATLEEAGHFYDPVNREVEELFLPWLLDEVVSNADAVQAAQSATDSLIKEALKKTTELQKKAKKQYEKKQKALEEARKLKEKMEEERLKKEREEMAAKEAAEE